MKQISSLPTFLPIIHHMLDAYCPKVVVHVTPPRACAHESFMSMLMKL